MKDKIFTNKKNGYTLLFSIIVASIVLSIAAFILSVSRKQFILSSVSRDSTRAIYAADSAMQCVIGAYYNSKLSTTSSGASVYCNGLTVTGSFNEIVGVGDPSHSMRNGDVGGTIYKIYTTATPLGFDFSNDTCAFVNITDGYDVATGNHKIVIESRGYNDRFSAPCAPGNNNPRTVERAIRLIYLD
jgi:Tfp pilus assembly protein PilE